MIIINKGDIFDQNTQAIVNPVNCVGVMGKGLAKQFKEKYPENFHAYKTMCDKGKVQIGQMFVLHNAVLRYKDPIIINFPTKDHWRNDSKMEYIDSGLESLRLMVGLMNITSIAIPALGCGLGGLDWNEVKLKIVDAFRDWPDENTLIILEP